MALRVWLFKNNIITTGPYKSASLKGVQELNVLHLVKSILSYTSVTWKSTPSGWSLSVKAIIQSMPTFFVN